jgi:hypothetical protein
MPDITSVLERAAAVPTRGPDIERPLRRQRQARLAAATSVTCAVVAAVVVFAIVLQPQHRNGRVQVEPPPPVTTATTATSHGASIDVPAGWHVTDKPLAPWLYSPFELFSIATSPLEQAPPLTVDPSRCTPPTGQVLRPIAGCNTNQAACPSEIPQVAVDGIAPDGAYLWIGEWRGGLYEAGPRPSTFDGVTLSDLCALPRGLKAYGGAFRDGTTDFNVTMMFGPDAPPARRAEINRMLDSLRF